MSFDNSNYVLLSRQISVFRESDVLSNNMANSHTPGFKAGRVIFKQYVHHATAQDRVHFNYDVLSVKDFSEGQMVKTGNTLDLALVGNAFFRIQTPDGERYSRAGNFQINGLGQIVTQQGYPVLSEDGQPIVLENDLGEIIIRENGTVTVGTEPIAQLGLAFFDDQQFLEPVGNNLYTATAAPTAEGRYKLFQGVVELSNVENISQMTRMVEMQHNLNAVGNFININEQLELNAFKAFKEGV
ncbi:flagellar basal-body rod protein FlgF [Rickettsiales endosymbiont of Stachyamoeba lipophora]|uniref:flagellar basal-body rod protein FlgF n=1 Tax=Rickettsiales endosymbiont of Stachyamoeba lipophora TaxID=2486578 RepID=UPI000F647C9B|nr:flagellar basal-body rod protein FlgF [Rickettsiales endosymbiont of Stachyamoeba lipophora]AZL15665.1 flagellar basal-body rod protein FlgF [Rickettsiales endosymbiont of Stachyamoeba lipophora]